ncbi:unnamed protein product [Musa acuminata subsp. malaccensis]|uniref:(wild Malaysian banana) hypothetical protein n=1 Tax=Musa acuminata subsp. malaccensis TaxID=214687 RepID=A0A804IWF4_MUSAM|nr:unnamed protein product [Musa acuminata subsp. malaccensis]
MLQNSSTSMSLDCIPSHRATCHSAVLIKHAERSLPPTLKKKRDFASSADADSSPILAVRTAGVAEIDDTPSGLHPVKSQRCQLACHCGVSMIQASNIGLRRLGLVLQRFEFY